MVTGYVCPVLNTATTNGIQARSQLSAQVDLAELKRECFIVHVIEYKLDGGCLGQLAVALLKYQRNARRDVADQLESQPWAVFHLADPNRFGFQWASRFIEQASAFVEAEAAIYIQVRQLEGAGRQSPDVFAALEFYTDIVQNFQALAEEVASLVFNNLRLQFCEFE